MPDITYDVGRVSFVMKGAWNLATAYEKLDAVSYNGSLYIAKQNVPGGTAITNTTYWQLAAEKGDQGEIGGVNSVNGRTGAVTGLAEEDAVGGTLRQLLAVSKSINFNDTAWVDLGTLNWTAISRTRFETSSPLSGAKDFGSNTIANAYCSRYQTVSYNTMYTTDIDKCLDIYFEGAYIQVRDTSYATAADFKAAMKGVLLAYETA